MYVLVYTRYVPHGTSRYMLYGTRQARYGLDVKKISTGLDSIFCADTANTALFEQRPSHRGILREDIFCMLGTRIVWTGITHRGT